MIDLHTHILPALMTGRRIWTWFGNGADAAAKGVTAIAATPISMSFPSGPWSSRRWKNCASLTTPDRGRIGGRAELMMDLGIMEMDAGEIPTYGDQGKFWLIEFPMRQIPCTRRKSS